MRKDRRSADVTRQSVLLRVVVLVAGALLLVGGLAGPASAHAELESTTPSDGSVVPTSPASLVLSFSEGISVEADGVRVVGADLKRVDDGRASARDRTVTVPLRPDVANGGYIVSWRVLSADGHPVQGAFQFFVGARTELDPTLAAKAFGGSSDRRDEVVGAVVRGFAYLGVLLSCGAVLVGGLLRRKGDPTPVNRLTTGAGSVALVALALQIPVQTSLVTGRGWGSVTEAGVLGRTLADGVGLSLGITALGLVAVIITSGLPFRGLVRVIALVGAAVAPLGFAITGHTRTMSPAAVAYAADAAHLFAGAVWLGGLVALLSLLRSRIRKDDVVGAADAVARFSGLAGITLAAVLVTGITLGWIEVGGPNALRTTTYGKLLMAKVATVGLVLIGATWNRFKLVPIIGRSAPADSTRVMAAEIESADASDEPGEPGLASIASPVELSPLPNSKDPRWGRFARVVGFELGGLVVVLALTAVLANVTPAKVAAHPGIVTVSAPMGAGRVEVIVDPGKAGRNDMHAYVLDAQGRLDGRYRAATFTLALPAHDIGPLVRTPAMAAPGHFILVGSDLVKGEWTLTISVRPDRFTEEKAIVPFKIR